MSYRKVKLCVEDVQGYNCLLNFHGMDMTRDKLCSLIKKKQSIIEGNVDARTTDGYVVRMFCIAFTKKQDDQLKETLRQVCKSALHPRKNGNYHGCLGWEGRSQDSGQGTCGRHNWRRDRERGIQYFSN